MAVSRFAATPHNNRLLQEMLSGDPMYAMNASAMQRGSSIAPVQSWGEGLARALQAPIGALGMQMAKGEAQKGVQSKNEALVNALLGPPAAGGAADPRREQIMQMVNSGALTSDAVTPALLEQMGLGPKKDRRIIQGPDGNPYYEDGSPVLPGVKAPPKQGRQRRIVQGPDGLPYFEDGSPVLPGVEAPPKEKKAPTVKSIVQPDGSEVVVQWNPDAGTWDRMNAPTGGAAVGDPRKKLTENQSKLTLFQNLQTETAPTLNQMEQVFDPSNVSDAAARGIPLVGNFLQSKEGQIYQATAAAWAEGALRISTGAAATQPEIERTIKTYFAQPGDDPATIMHKRNMRDMFSRSIVNALGGTSEGTLPAPDFANGNQRQGGGDIGNGISVVPGKPKRKRFDPKTGKFEEVQ